MELEEFKLKAKKVMQTFNTKPRAYPPSSSQTVLTGRTVKVSMTNFGVAFPLEFTQTHEGKNADSPPTKAFLIAIDSLEFHTHEGERGQFVMKGFSFQFVPRHGHFNEYPPFFINQFVLADSTLQSRVTF